MAHLRLAIVTPRFWPLVGDSPTHLLRLAESLIAAGQAVTVVTPQWKRSWPARMAIGKVPLVRLRGSPRGGWSTLRWIYALASWLREAGGGGLDGVLVAGLKYEAYVALGAARRTNTPTVLIAGEDDFAWQRTAALGGRIAARCRECRAIVAPSGELASELCRNGFSADPISIISRRVPIPPPQSPKSRDDARAAVTAANYDLVTTANTQVAMAIGRLDAAHRFGDLVRAWRIVTARRPEARLWIVGDGPERERLYQQIGDLDQRFRALLPGTFDCLEELFQASDMLLVPAAHTVPPLAMLEAQAAGLPVVAADAPALRGHVTADQTGLLYPPGDIKALAAAVLQLIEQPAAGVIYGATARQTAQSSPTPQNEAAEYVALFERLRSSG
jgi:glycosyltransferase involved in cell wall biosynthesis